MILPEIMLSPVLSNILMQKVRIPRLIAIAKWLIHYGYAEGNKLESITDLVGAVDRAADFLGFKFSSAIPSEKDQADLEIVATYILRVMTGIMAIPRCGHSDKPSHHAIANNGWMGMGIDTVRIKIQQPLPGIGLTTQEILTEECIQQWRNVCGVRCKMVTSNEPADLAIGICDRASGSDGRGAMLAFTYLPQDWNKNQLPMPLLFDIAERFGTSADGQTIGYKEVVTHELGHGLIGLSHAAANVNALMAPYYKPGLMAPTSHDIQRALMIWPLPPVQPKPPVTPPSSPVDPRKPTNTIQVYSDGSVTIIPSK